MPYLHLSLQSGDNLILKRMKRRHNREMVLSICSNLKSFMKRHHFWSRLDCWVPNRNRRKFSKLNRPYFGMSNFKCTYISILTKEGTPASKMPQIKKELINKRVQIAKNFSENIKKIMETKNWKKTKHFYMNLIN